MLKLVLLCCYRTHLQVNSPISYFGRNRSQLKITAFYLLINFYELLNFTNLLNYYTCIKIIIVKHDKKMLP